MLTHYKVSNYHLVTKERYSQLTILNNIAQKLRKKRFDKGAISFDRGELRFKIDENGLSLIAMDPTNSAMVVYNLLASAFDEYECSGPAKMTISIPYLVSILKRAKEYLKNRDYFWNIGVFIFFPNLFEKLVESLSLAKILPASVVIIGQSLDDRTG